MFCVIYAAVFSVCLTVLYCSTIRYARFNNLSSSLFKISSWNIYVHTIGTQKVMKYLDRQKDNH